MLAHHTRGGCPLRPGDLVATGTLSGPTKAESGCFFEQTRGGKEPYELKALKMGKGSVQRGFLEDNDTVEFRAQVSLGDGLGNVSFGVCGGKVLPAL